MLRIKALFDLVSKRVLTDSGFVAFLRIFGKFSSPLLRGLYQLAYITPQQRRRKFAKNSQKSDET
jgi:hypothetical protein